MLINQIAAFLTAPIFEGKIYSHREFGIPQGSSLLVVLGTCTLLSLEYSILRTNFNFVFEPENQYTLLRERNGNIKESKER